VRWAEVGYDGRCEWLRDATAAADTERYTSLFVGSVGCV